MQRSQSGVYIYVVDEASKTVKDQPVTVLQMQDGTAVIGSGLAANERVVVDGQYKLKPGSRVAEVARGPASAASGGRVASGAGK